MKFLFPFQEDSSLIFAARLSGMLRPRGHSIEFLRIIDRNGEEGVSERQLQQYLGNVNVRKVDQAEVISENALNDADAVIVSRVVEPMRKLLRQGRFKANRKRPCFVAFQPGLEFSPERGLNNRRDFDILFVNKPEHAEFFAERTANSPWQYIGFGHPYFLMPEQWVNESQGRKNIYFFAQAVSPFSLKSRTHIVRVLAAIAEANPERKVFIKLRHLPDENQNHVHKEQHDYSSIVEAFQQSHEIPPNLSLTACSMSEALADAAICITCTSTAAMDSISAGIPTAVYLDYTDLLSDKLNAPMRAEFADSNLILSLDDLLNLRINRPSPTWLASRFRGPDLIDEIEASVAAFKSKTARDLM